jgi:hypothetical protein
MKSDKAAVKVPELGFFLGVDLVGQEVLLGLLDVFYLFFHLLLP